MLSVSWICDYFDFEDKQDWEGAFCWVGDDPPNSKITRNGIANANAPFLEEKHACVSVVINEEASQPYNAFLISKCLLFRLKESLNLKSWQ